MCNAKIILFGYSALSRGEIEGKSVIEVGSYDYDGSLRTILESWNPARYVGVDIQQGPGVDLICPIEKLTEKFGSAQFDVVVSTELVEHLRDWRTGFSNLKNICRPNGTILLTTRSRGFKYHGYPHDFWRYEIEDMRAIFSDFDIERLEEDGSMPGVFLKARKPDPFSEADLSEAALYSMIHDRRVRTLDPAAWTAFQRRYERRTALREKRQALKRAIRNFFS